jgi:hypothetical protein
MEVPRIMDEAHKLLAQSAGSLSLQIARKKLVPADIVTAYARVERALGLLRQLVAITTERGK